MASPLDQFKIISYFPLGFGNYQISFTNSALAMLIGSVLQISLLWLLPKRFSVFKGVGELYYEFISGLVLSCAGKKAGFLIPFVSAIFSTIFFGNIIGLVPSIFTFTSHLIPNFLLAIIVLLMVVLIGLYRNGFEFFRIFWPKGVPFVINLLIMIIELFTFLMRSVSLCLRLSMNMMVGHITLKVLLGLAKDFGIVGGISVAPMYFFIFFLEVGFAFLQAYIFALMTCVYLQDAVESHH